jgi:hypothetical protein
MTVPRTTPGLPPPSPELCALSTFLQAYVRSLSRKKRALFLKAVAELMETRLVLGNVVRLRADTDEAFAEARAKADAWVLAMLDVLMAACE